MNHKVVNQYNAFRLNEYNDVFEIVSGNDNEGVFYPTWVIVSEYSKDEGGGVPVKKDNGKYRNMPVKVILGNREEAIENLKWLLKQLDESKEEDAKDSNDQNDSGDADSDVPF